MKKTFKIFAFLLIFISTAHFSEAINFDTFKMRRDEISFDLGYSYAELKQENDDDLAYAPLFITFNFDLDEKLNKNFKKTNLQFGLQPYIAQIFKPGHDIMFGLNLLLRYNYDFTSEFRYYAEIGSGPMYLGINTYEQDDRGFNFTSHLGSGIKYFFQPDKSLNLGYQFSHTSHGETRNSKNGGIDSHMLTVGYSKYF